MRSSSLPAAAVLLITLVAGVSPVAAAGDPGKTFVLVAGTWHGGWVWRDVRRALRRKGHTVFTPTLTGTGERIHLMSPDIGLDTHIEDVVNVIEYEELSDVILVGHSFAGLVITGVADAMRERIRRVVFLDALVPSSNRLSGVTRDPETGGLPEWWQKRAEKFVDGYQMVFSEAYPLKMLVPDSDEAAKAWLSRRLTNHPARAWSDELKLVNGGWAGLPRTIIRCVGQIYSPSSERMAGPALTEPGWQIIELDASRDAMVTHPKLVADTLAMLE